MKSLLTALALFSFVAASTVTMIAPAQAVTHHPKKHSKHMTQDAAHHKKGGGSKMKKPAAA